MNQTEEANSEKHYFTIAIAVLIGVTGVYLRFADFRSATIVANILFVSGIAIALKGVFGILK
jgi:hypothetical membrane protein